MLNKWSLFPTEDEKEISLVERETRPAGLLGALKNSIKSSALGALIAGSVSAAVGFIFGAMFGADGAEEIISEVTEEGSIRLGGAAHFAPKLNAYLVLPKETIMPMLEAKPELTAAMINGINGGVQNMIGGTIGGAAVGGVKGGWVDYIVKERELSSNPETATQSSTYCK